MCKMLRYAGLLLLIALGTAAEPVRVRYLQGELHAFLLVHDSNGKLVGKADEVHVAVGHTWRRG